MQISKLLPAMTISMGVFCLGLVSVRADDTPEQAAARAALMEKMSALDTQDASPTNAVAPAESSVIVVNNSTATTDTNQTPVMVNAPASVSPATGLPEAPAAVVTPPPARTTGEPEFSPAPPPSWPNINTGAAQTTMNASQTNVVIISTPISSPPPASANSYSPAAQTTMNPPQTNVGMVSTPTTPPPAPAVSTMANEPTVPSVNTVTAKALGLTPLQAPPPPVTAAQQQQLDALLQQYEADQITPDQYQAARAKIMAGQ